MFSAHAGESHCAALQVVIATYTVFRFPNTNLILPDIDSGEFYVFQQVQRHVF